MNNLFENDDLKRLIFTYLKQPKKHYLGNSPSYDAIKDFCFGIEREQLHVLNPLLHILKYWDNDDLQGAIEACGRNGGGDIRNLGEDTLLGFCLDDFFTDADSDVEDLVNNELYDPETNMTELHYYGEYELNELTLTPT